MKRIIIIGASSGLGYGITEDFAQMGWKVGIAARREEPLKELCQKYPDNICYETIDVTADDAAEKMLSLINSNGGMDTLLLASGIGKQNPDLQNDIDTRTTLTNVVGFTRIVDAAFNYFKAEKKEGHIAVISSIAGTKGLGVAASYSASKRYQYIYIDALEQLAHMQGVKIKFTDIRPGFISTPLLDGVKNYPMTMTTEYAIPRITKAILKQKRIAIIDWKWAIGVALWKLIPRCLWKRLPIKN